MDVLQILAEVLGEGWQGWVLLSYEKDAVMFHNWKRNISRIYAKQVEESYLYPYFAAIQDVYPEWEEINFCRMAMMAFRDGQVVAIEAEPWSGLELSSGKHLIEVLGVWDKEIASNV